uniref:Hsp70-binding protein 1 n=2 Tax=Scleropages formosus TaxID=113540 RepID=A0A8C9RJ48_SCLFO
MKWRTTIIMRNAASDLPDRPRPQVTMAQGGGERQHPRNLQGVLRMAVEAGSAADGPAPSEPMSEERKAWLREALAELCHGQRDEVEQMKECLAVLRRGLGGGEDVCEDEDEDEDGVEAALELLSELCENLDNARDLMALGGLDLCLSRCLSHRRGEVRWRAAQLFASCAQNMPEVQCYLLQQEALLRLLRLTDTDEHPTVRVKALYAVSCLVREQEAGLRAFLSHDGFSVLMRGMQSDNEKLRTKSAFLLLNLLTAYPEHRDTVLSMGMVQQLVSVLRSPHSPFHEHVLGALCCLVDECPRGVRDCREPALGLGELLKHRAEELEGRPESQEELEFCERLRAACFQGQLPDDNGMDR